MKSLTTALTITLLLSGCAQTPSGNTGGFSVIEYSREQRNTAADEMEGGQCPILNQMINDYSVLRDQARVRG